MFHLLQAATNEQRLNVVADDTKGEIMTGSLMWKEQRPAVPLSLGLYYASGMFRFPRCRGC